MHPWTMDTDKNAGLIKAMFYRLYLTLAPGWPLSLDHKPWTQPNQILDMLYIYTLATTTGQRCRNEASEWEKTVLFMSTANQGAYPAGFPMGGSIPNIFNWIRNIGRQYSQNASLGDKKILFLWKYGSKKLQKNNSHVCELWLSRQFSQNVDTPTSESFSS